jgi:hypothetical protein
MLTPVTVKRSSSAIVSQNNRTASLVIERDGNIGPFH